MIPGFEELLEGHLVKAVIASNNSHVGPWWPILPVMGILISIRIKTEDDAITAISCLFSLIILGGLDIAQIAVFHPIVYGILVISTAMMMFKTFWGNSQ